MRWCGVLLVVVASFLVTGGALLASKFPTRESTTKRFLRADNPGSYSFKGINRVNGDFEEDSASTDNLEERAGGVGILEKIKTLKAFKSISRGVAKATNSFSEKISQALPIKSKLQVWSNNGKSVSFVRKELGMDGLDSARLTLAKNFKFYDDYVTSQLPLWANKQLTPREVASKLSFRGLSGAVRSNPNFKYYDEYLVQQALVWAKKDADVDKILVRLGLNLVPAAERSQAVNNKYYDEFVAGLLRTWKEKDVPVTEVMTKLKLDQLTGEALLPHPNYKYYKNYVKNNLKAWATKGDSLDDVAVRLGLDNLQGKRLEAHPNFVFLEKYWTKRGKYQENGWLKQGMTSQSATYEAYEKYVNLIDDHIIRLHKRGFQDDQLPRLISKDATADELREKTIIWIKMKRPEWYVKFSLGLDGLGENALKEAHNFQFYKYYIDSTNAVKHTI
ncbi:hypothetical protein L914_00308 [Phytophthora nicotianae]|uniref:RxLR effector protein n=1 Tax=Phytophthora nicotianae TaxID=4792 RepID=W2P999_PHYNI|nr:hypothetical protein L914_00308 [Phytophthora nicotianae]